MVWLHPARTGDGGPGDLGAEEEPAVWLSAAGAARGPLPPAPIIPTAGAPADHDPPAPAAPLPATGTSLALPLGAAVAALGWTLRRRARDSSDRERR
jgi:hypothetical protein